MMIPSAESSLAVSLVEHSKRFTSEAVAALGGPQYANMRRECRSMTRCFLAYIRGPTHGPAVAGLRDM